LQEGHVWVYRSDMVSAAGAAPGTAVSVTDERGKFLGTALYSSASQIAIRMISSHPVDNLPSLVRERIRAAISYRERVVRNTDAYRVVFSEADFLPGLIVDRYHDLLSVQVLTQAMDAEPVRQVIVCELSQQLKPASIAERVDPRIRELEQLPARPSGLIQGEVQNEKTSTVFSMNGVRFHYEALEGQKTGAFLDQRENYAAAAAYAHGEALDVFCYQGEWAMHAKRGGAERVIALDASESALAATGRNLERNGLAEGVELRKADAFDALLQQSGLGGPPLIDDTPLAPPTTHALSLAVAQKCNLGCTYCYAQQGEFGGAAKNMALADAERAVDLLVDGAPPGARLNLAFLGGEPLVNRPVVQAATRRAVERAERRGVAITFSITTNGTLLTEADADFFETHGFAVTVSLDGPRAAHDALRPYKNGRGSFDTAMRRLEPLLLRSAACRSRRA